MTAKNQAFPALFWHPETGDAEVYHAAVDVPEGHLPYHPNHKEARDAAPKVAPTLPPLTKDEIKAKLDAFEIKYAPNLGQKALYELLVRSLKEHFTAEGVAFDENATAPELLELLPKA